MTQDMTPLHTFELGDKGQATQSAQLTPEGKVIAGGQSSGLFMLDPRTGKKELLHDSAGRSRWTIKVSPSGDEALVVMGNSVVTLWDLESHALVDERDLLSNVADVAWMRGEDHALAGAQGGLFVVELEEEGSWNRLEKDVPYRATASVGNRAAAAVEGRSVVELWRPGYRKNGKNIHILEGHSGQVETLAFAPTGELLACGDQDGQVLIWSPQRRRLLQTLKLHKGPVRSVAFSPRARRLLSGGADGEVVLYDLPTQTEMRREQAHKGGVNQVGWIKDGTQAVTCGQDGTVKVWELPGQAPAPIYSPLRTYEPGDLIDHPTFGEGEIESVHHDRIHVVFSNQTKTLVHARGD